MCPVGQFRSEFNNKDEDNSRKTLNDKNQQTLSQKFRQLMRVCYEVTDFVNKGL